MCTLFHYSYTENKTTQKCPAFKNLLLLQIISKLYWNSIGRNKLGMLLSNSSEVDSYKSQFLAYIITTEK